MTENFLTSLLDLISCQRFANALDIKAHKDAEPIQIQQHEND